MAKTLLNAESQKSWEVVAKHFNYFGKLFFMQAIMFGGGNLWFYIEVRHPNMQQANIFPYVSIFFFSSRANLQANFSFFRGAIHLSDIM